MSNYPYFSHDELKCRHCGEEKMDPAFMGKLIQIRERCDFPFSVTSAYRCPEHNDNVSSTGANGPHTTGRAIDIRANARQKALILKAAADAGFTRFGIARTFIHIDDLGSAEGFDDDVIWTYN